MKITYDDSGSVLDEILQRHKIRPVSHVNLSPSDFEDVFTEIKENGESFNGSDDHWYSWNNITFYLDVYEEDYEV